MSKLEPTYAKKGGAPKGANKRLDSKNSKLTDIRLIHHSRLMVDHEVNTRDVIDSKVKELVAEWNPRKVGVLEVSQRDTGVVAVLNGQQRLAAKRIRLQDHEPDDESFWCEVHFGLTKAEEADIFLGINNSAQVHPISKFFARVTKGEPIALAMRDALRQRNLSVDFKTAKGYPCVGLLEKIYGWNVLESTLDLIEGAWPSQGLNRAKHIRQMVEGAALLIVSCQDDKAWSLDRAIERFNKVNPIKLWKGVRNESLGVNTNQAVMVARALRAAYREPRQVQKLSEIAVPRGYRG